MITNKVKRKIVLDETIPPVARGIISIDFDGTIVPWGDLFAMKTAFPGIPELAVKLKELGFTIVILTSRMSPSWWAAEGWDQEEAREEQLAYVISVLNQNGIPFDRITAEKIPCMAYIDDKAIGFRGDWAQTTKELAAFLNIKL